MNKLEGLHKVDSILETEKTKINEKKEQIYQVINLKKDFKYNVTDHALIQYLRRIRLLPPSEARFRILTEIEEMLRGKNMELLKDVTYKIISPSNVIYLVRNKSIITVEVNEK